ncbi:hypothetical protein B0H13DRAFT_2373729, partial [Mycena leptocephala]
NLPVVVLARPGSKSTDKLPAGTKLATCFRPSLGTPSGAQKSLIEAAKAREHQAVCSVRVWSANGRPERGIWAEKNQIAEQLKSAGIPSLRIYVQRSFHRIHPWLFLNAETKKIHIVGKGEAPISATALPDVAGFVVHVLTTLPSAELENKIFRIEGERIKANDLDGDIKTIVATELDSGLGSTGWSVVTKSEGTGDAAASSANKLWPGHHWKTIKEVHGL